MSDSFESDLADFACDFISNAHEVKYAREHFRTETWETKDGRVIAIKDMSDRHLFNAYKWSQGKILFREILFREMVLRLFEDRLGIEL